MNLIKLATFMFATILSLNAIARDPVPIVNHENVVVTTTSGNALTAEQVKQAILNAAAAKKWTVALQADGKLEATRNERNKHFIVVEIAYANDKYSLNYKGSTNMKYRVVEGNPVIHPYYNRCVQELKDAIRVELLKT